MALDINNSRNLALIWDCYHWYLHTKDYYDFVNETVETAYNKGGSKSKKKSYVLAVVAEIKKQLESTLG